MEQIGTGLKNGFLGLEHTGAALEHTEIYLETLGMQPNEPHDVSNGSSAKYKCPDCMGCSDSRLYQPGSQLEQIGAKWSKLEQLGAGFEGNKVDWIDWE